MAGPILVDQTFSTTAPAGRRRGRARPDRGERRVPQPKEVDYIAGDILDRAGWPSDDIDVADTSFVLDEFIVDDGASWWDTLARLVGSSATRCGTTRTASSTSPARRAPPASTTRSPPTTSTRSGSHDRQPARHVARLGDGPVRPPHARQGPRAAHDAEERVDRGVADVEVPPARRLWYDPTTPRTCASSTAARSGCTSCARATGRSSRRCTWAASARTRSACRATRRAAPSTGSSRRPGGRRASTTGNRSSSSARATTTSSRAGRSRTGAGRRSRSVVVVHLADEPRHRQGLQAQQDGRLVDRELLDHVQRRGPDEPVGADDRRHDAVLLLREQRHDGPVPHRERGAPADDLGRREDRRDAAPRRRDGHDDPPTATATPTRSASSRSSR
jgi:hypothetical protein